MDYRRVQWGYQLVPGFAGAIVIGISLLGDEHTSGFVKLLFVMIALVGLGVLGLFSRLEVTVGDQTVEAAFGSGWPRKRIDLDDISRARAVRNKWWFGLGIRKVPKGWMYNVWGLDAVELDLVSGKSFRIGTNDVDGLMAALPSPAKQGRGSGPRRRPGGRGRV